MVDIDAVIPARLAGYVRTWDVAFPNDGSQDDKGYFDADGRRPPFVLFVNVRASTAFSTPVNSVLVPVADDESSKLEQRERRYNVMDVTDEIEVCSSFAMRRYPVTAFLGREEFTRPDDVARG